MAAPERFAVDPARVVHETIEGETIVIHLETGTYYSLQGTAVEIWSMLDHGWSEDEVVAELGRRYQAAESALAVSVREFTQELVGDELVVRRNGTGATGAEPIAGRRGEEFSPPRLEKYTDMQYFLLLDPVHEVEASGWPHAGDSARD